MTNYKHPRNLHELAMTVSHKEMNVKLGELGYVKQQKGGFWVEHHSFVRNEHGKRTHRRTKQKSKYTGRWDRKNRIAVKSDYLQRVQAKNITSAVCLPSVSPVLVANTFSKFGVKNLFGFEIGTKEYKACKKALKANPKVKMAVCNGDVMNHLNLFKTGCFVEADFCGAISTYKKFFLNLPQYWSLTVCSTRYGCVDKILSMFGKFIGGKVKRGELVTVQKNGGEYEYTTLTVKNQTFHLYKYRDPNPETNKCATMVVITNI